MSLPATSSIDSESNLTQSSEQDTSDLLKKKPNVTFIWKDGGDCWLYCLNLFQNSTFTVLQPIPILQSVSVSAEIMELYMEIYQVSANKASYHHSIIIPQFTLISKTIGLKDHFSSTTSSTISGAESVKLNTLIIETGALQKALDELQKNKPASSEEAVLEVSFYFPNNTNTTDNGLLVLTYGKDNVQKIIGYQDWRHTLTHKFSS
jgi:hypothetical protein